jgi:hypothetical protein
MKAVSIASKLNTTNSTGAYPSALRRATPQKRLLARQMRFRRH